MNARSILNLGLFMSVAIAARPVVAADGPGWRSLDAAALTRWMTSGEWENLPLDEQVELAEKRHGSISSRPG